MSPVAKILTFFFNLHHPRTISDVVKEDSLLFQMSLLGFMKKWEKILLKIRKRAIQRIPPLPVQGPRANPSRPWQLYRAAEDLPNAFSLSSLLVVLSYHNTVY